MAIYAIWNNKGGVGKSYLTFQVASEYAQQNPDKKVLVIDLCPQANSSSMLLGGMINGENALTDLHGTVPRTSIAGYIDDRIVSPYQNPRTGSRYLTRLSGINQALPTNLYLIAGDEQLELQSSRVRAATERGPDDAWRLVHMWIRDLIADIANAWADTEHTVFIVDGAGEGRGQSSRQGRWLHRGHSRRSWPDRGNTRHQPFCGRRAWGHRPLGGFAMKQQHQTAYTRWLDAEIQAAIDDPRPSIPHEEVMARMDAQIAHLKEGRTAEHTAQ